MIILLHSSKSMRQPQPQQAVTQPQLLDKAIDLHAYLKTLSTKGLTKAMHISPSLAIKVHQQIVEWNSNPKQQSLAIDSFVGDIYSGLRANDLTATDRNYAQEHLVILSGLYGLLRPFDGVRPYRLEMAYRFPRPPFNNLYTFWGSNLAKVLPSDEVIINTSSHEYTEAILPHLTNKTIITPSFLTINPSTMQPTQVIVHTKMARGALARWLITGHAQDISLINQFSDLGYRYEQQHSTPTQPVFICKQFGGIGLSQRLL